MLHGHSNRLLGLLIAGILSASMPVLALEGDFNQAYSAYQAAVTANDTAEIQSSAQQAYDLGKVKFGDTSIDTVNLGLNLARGLMTQYHNANKKPAENKAKANELYLSALKAYDIEYGKQGIELVDALLGAAETASEPKDAKKLFERAIDIAEFHKNPTLVAITKTTAFDTLSRTDIYSRTIRNYAIEALAFYRQALPADSVDRLAATVNVAEVYFSEKKNTQAIELYEELVTQYGVLSYDHPYKLMSHARLVELYELEDDSDKSTAHCIAIGSMKPWADAQEQQPLFRLHPNYPRFYAKDRKEGWVEIAFTVDESGFVTKPEVLRSHGGQKFEKTSLEALKKWRYAPKFVDGQAVAAKSTVRLDYTVQ
jgi:TonB family protein